MVRFEKITQCENEKRSGKLQINIMKLALSSWISRMKRKRVSFKVYMTDFFYLPDRI